MTDLILVGRRHGMPDWRYVPAVGDRQDGCFWRSRRTQSRPRAYSSRARPLAASAHSRSCDGFRMLAPSLSLQHAPRPPGRRSNAASEGNRGRGARLSTGAMGISLAPTMQQRSWKWQWFGRAVAPEEGMRSNFVEFAGRLRGRWRAKAVRTSAVSAGPLGATAS
jgi:hypothetical protein